MKNTSIHTGHFQVRRQRLLIASLVVLTAITMTLVVWRLTGPLAPLHLSTKTSGEIGTSTHNPYAGVAGTLTLWTDSDSNKRDQSGRGTVALNQADTENDRSRGPSQHLLAEVLRSPTLTAALQAPLKAAAMDFVVERPPFISIKQGRQMGLSVNPQLQAYSQSLVECYTGSHASCNDLQPRYLFHDPQFAPGGLRAGMAALLVVDEDSGRVLASAGALSTCSKAALLRRAQANTQGRFPIFADGKTLCAQFPDARHADWLGHSNKGYAQIKPGEELKRPDPMILNASLDPAHLPLPLGSIAKIELAIACIQADLLPVSDAQARSEFAKSANNDFFKKFALDCRDAYDDVFRHSSRAVDLIWPTQFAGAGGYPGWQMRPQPQVLPAGATLSAATYLAVDGRSARSQRRHHSAADGSRLRGVPFKQLETSRLLTSLAIGDAGRIGYLAQHARLLRELGLASRGVAAATPIHLVRDNYQPLPLVATAPVGNAYQATRVLNLLSGVSAFGGTAHAACQRVLAASGEACPAAGLEVAGKTGTSDVADPDAPQWVQAGFPDPVPVKHLVMRFEAGGRWLIVAAQVLRARDAKSGRLDNSNAAAELGFLIRAELQRPRQVS